MRWVETGSYLDRHGHYNRRFQPDLSGFVNPSPQDFDPYRVAYVKNHDGVFNNVQVFPIPQKPAAYDLIIGSLYNGRRLFP